MEYNQEYVKLSKTILSTNEINILNNWTSKKCDNVLFDSDIDNWDINKSDLSEKI